MAAAQPVQKQQLDAVSKEKVVAEVRELLQGLKVEQAWVEAVVKQAEQRLEPLAADTQVTAGKDKGTIQCSERDCHVELLLSLSGGQTWKFSGDAIGHFDTPGDASFNAYGFRLSASLDDLFSLTSYFFIAIEPNNSVFMAFLDRKPGTSGTPRLLAVLKTHITSGKPVAGVGMGPGSWESLCTKA